MFIKNDKFVGRRPFFRLYFEESTLIFDLLLCIIIRIYILKIKWSFNEERCGK